MQLAPKLWGLGELTADPENFPVAEGHHFFPFQVRLRQYRDCDREEIRRICCDTGFLGNPIDPLYQDRELFADLFTNAYLEYEPEWTLVAEKEGRVAGYLTGSVSPHFNRNLFVSGFQMSCKMFNRFITGKYKHHPRSEQFVRWLLTRGLIEQPDHPEDAAHLHLNLEKPLRWGSVARRLLSTFENMILATGIDHYYAKFFSCPQRNPERLYVHLGFQVYDRSETTFFRPEISDRVFIVCVHKRLNGAAPWQ